MFEAQSEWDFHAPTLADAHREWHYVYGANAFCDLDCGAGEVYDYCVDDPDEDISYAVWQDGMMPV